MAWILLTCFAEEIAMRNAVSQEMHLCSICWKAVSTYFKIAEKWNGKPDRSAHKLNSGSGPPAAPSWDGGSLLLGEIFPRGKIHAALRQSLCSRENHLLRGKKRTTSRILWASWRTLWSTDQRRTGEVSGFTTLKQRIPSLPCHRRSKQCPLPWGWVVTPLIGGF